jgi:hypothetical protein
VEIKQRYENKEKNPIEAVYQFPLDAKASVCDFWAEIDGKKVIGQSNLYISQVCVESRIHYMLQSKRKKKQRMSMMMQLQVDMELIFLKKVKFNL